MAVCGRCGEDNPARARFCLGCGNELGAPEAQARKIVTVLFADVVDSTGLGERLDPEAFRALMGRFFTCAEAAISSHGGVVEKFVGDAVMAVFGIPQAHEDDALRAIRASIQLQTEIARMNEERTDSEIAIRIGINSGEVLAGSSGEGQGGVFGDPVNAAARLEKLAPPKGIIIGEATFRLVRGAITSKPMGPVIIKGKAEPVTAHLVLAVDPHSSPTRNLEAPMVGRRRELDALVRAFERASEDRVCVLFTLLGPAGIGKSRLINELAGSSPVPPRVLGGRCLPYGDGITFWPVIEVMSDAAHISDRDSQEEALAKLAGLVEEVEEGHAITNLVGQLMGLSEQSGSQEETFWAVRKVFETLAAREPMLVVFDDIHWAEETLLDLIDHIVDWAHDSPLLVACLARPELLESRPTWAGGKHNATTILLEPLKESDSKQLFSGLLGDTSAIDSMLPRIVEVAEGNPFFLEETVAMLADEGVIERVNGRWVANADLEDISIPPTINALLTARLDQLPTSERVIIEFAAVMGKVFASEAVGDLSADVAESQDALQSLCKKGLLRLAQEEFAGEEMYRFRHILIRDAAYQGIPKERRAELHERYADWLIKVLGERSGEYDEIIGYHYEQAHKYATALGIASSEGLALRAGEALAKAGRRAFGRSDLAAAINLLSRATKFYPENNPARSYLLLDLGQTLWEQGDYALSESYFEESLAAATRYQDAKAEARARLHLAEVHVHNRPLASTKDYRATIEGLIPECERMQDHDGLAFAYRQLSYAFDSVGDSTGAAEALTKAVEHAAAGGDATRETTYRRTQIQSMSWGPTPVAEMERRTLEFLRWAEEISDRRSIAIAHGILAPIEASRGNFDTARDLIRKEIEIYDDLGLDIARAWSVFEHVTVESLAGTPTAAEAELGRACEVLRRLGEKAVLPTILGMLANVRVHQGMLDEAEALIAEALAAAAEDDILTMLKCKAVLAKLRAAQGRGEEAFALAQEATEVADATEWLDWRAFTWIDRASVAHVLGRDDDAKEALSTASQLFGLKGMEHPAANAARLLTKLV